MGKNSGKIKKLFFGKIAEKQPKNKDNKYNKNSKNGKNKDGLSNNPKNNENNENNEVKAKNESPITEKISKTEAFFICLSLFLPFTLGLTIFEKQLGVWSMLLVALITAVGLLLAVLYGLWYRSFGIIGIDEIFSAVYGKIGGKIMLFIMLAAFWAVFVDMSYTVAYFWGLTVGADVFGILAAILLLVALMSVSGGWVIGRLARLVVFIALGLLIAGILSVVAKGSLDNVFVLQIADGWQWTHLAFGGFAVTYGLAMFLLPFLRDIASAEEIAAYHEQLAWAADNEKYPCSQKESSASEKAENMLSSKINQTNKNKNCEKNVNTQNKNQENKSGKGSQVREIEVNAAEKSNAKGKSRVAFFAAAVIVSALILLLAAYGNLSVLGVTLREYQLPFSHLLKYFALGESFNRTEIIGVMLYCSIGTVALAFMLCAMNRLTNMIIAVKSRFWLAVCWAVLTYAAAFVLLPEPRQMTEMLGGCASYAVWLAAVFIPVLTLVINAIKKH